MLSKSINPVFIYNLILIITFSVSVNTYVLIQNINLFFYILFHLVFIYFIFYHYSFTHFFLALIYGVLFDIFLINIIGSHLISFIMLISIFLLFKKYLFLLSSIQVTLVILIVLNLLLFIEMFLAYLLNNIYFNFSQILKYLIISFIIFIPTISILNKLSR